jgi:predicted ATPase
LSPTPGRSDLASLCDYFGPTEALMVLDNCEHLLDAAADLVAEMVERCPGVRVLCTSREPLNLAGEQLLPVRPLDPSGDALILLDDRVREVAPDLDVLGVEQAAALEICQRLDGVPHALELAAARAATMTLDEIARGLDDRFRLLASGRRRSVERHQTLRASLDWSHQLLSEPAQRLFRRLAVFAGGFDTDAAQAVAVQSGENLEVAELLASLVRSSIAEHDRTSSRTRFRLLETIRSYAQERLQEAGEATSVSRAHAEWMVSLVGHPFEEWCTAGSGLYQRFEAERDNWREAVGFALASQDPRLAVSLLTNMGCIETEEAVPLAAEALKLPGVEAVPGYHWLHRTIAMRGGMLFDAELLTHVDQFDAKCTSPQERAYLAHSHATRGVVTGYGPNLGPIAQALAIPGLSPQLVAFLKLHQSMWTNWPEPVDIEVARRAVEAARKANTIYVPLAEAFLAGALRKDHPDEALALAHKVVETDLDELNPFARAGIHASTSTIVTDVPVHAAAVYLRDRLAGLQASLTGVEMTYFAVCANVLARANHPAAATIRSFVVSHGHAHTYANLLPDLPETSAPKEMDRLIATVRIALDEVISGATPQV